MLKRRTPSTSAKTWFAICASARPSCAERQAPGEVSVLGEVAADQSRYAEVAPPTGGQIVRVLGRAQRRCRAGSAAGAVAQHRPRTGPRRPAVSGSAARSGAADARTQAQRSPPNGSSRTREVQEAEAAFRAADAEARAAVAALRALGIQEDDVRAGDSSLFYLRSPIARSGHRSPRDPRPVCRSDAPLFTVADLSRVWLIAQVFERDAVNLRLGSTAHVTLAALPGQEFDGRVTQVGRQVDAGSRTVPVRVELANTDGVLRPGMSANARLEVAGESTDHSGRCRRPRCSVSANSGSRSSHGPAGVRDAAGWTRTRPRQ